MNYKATLSRDNLFTLFRAKVVEYFEAMYPNVDRADVKGFNRKVDDYANNQFTHVVRGLNGESVGIEGSDLTCAFYTSMGLRVRPYPYRKMVHVEKLTRLYEFYAIEHPGASIRIDDGYTVSHMIQVYIGRNQIDPAMQVERRLLADWMERNVPVEC